MARQYNSSIQKYLPSSTTTSKYMIEMLHEGTVIISTEGQSFTDDA